METKNIPALSTVFTPESDCFQFFAGAATAAEDCYPPEWNDYIAAGGTFSPGICPESWEIVTFPSTNGIGETLPPGPSDVTGLGEQKTTRLCCHADYWTIRTDNEASLFTTCLITYQTFTYLPTAIKIVWESSDLESVLFTHPLTPGLALPGATLRPTDTTSSTTSSTSGSGGQDTETGTGGAGSGKESQGNNTGAGLSTGAIVGIVIGVVAVVLVGVVAVITLARIKRRSRAASGNTPSETPQISARERKFPSNPSDPHDTSAVSGTGMSSPHVGDLGDAALEEQYRRVQEQRTRLQRMEELDWQEEQLRREMENRRTRSRGIAELEGGNTEPLELDVEERRIGQ